jgi:hypothetical protein
MLLLGTTLLEFTTHGPVSAKALLAAFMVVWCYLLIQGIRWVWIGTIGIYVVGFITEMISGSLDWLGAALSLIGFILLILPMTRRYFSGDTVAD